jgi:hypothetical protein
MKLPRNEEHGGGSNNNPGLRHLVRLRRTDDLMFLQPGLFDELLINANHLENSSESTVAHLWQTELPYMVDPVLWRFQVPAWWRNPQGENKRNYARLGRAYSAGTNFRIAEGPLLQTVPNDSEWERLSANVVRYELDRLAGPSQLDFLDERTATELRPARVIAPALVALSNTEDRVNRILVDAAAAAAEKDVVAQVIIPDRRLRDRREVNALLTTLAVENVSAYFLWTPSVTEDMLLSDPSAFVPVLAIITALRERGIPVVHLQGSYVTAALHEVGLSGVAYHLGWIDKGEPASEQQGGPRSCQTYVPGVRYSLRFTQALHLGRHLTPSEYLERYCDCTFCAGVFAEGQQHPLDLLLEEQTIDMGDGRHRQTPTSRAATANTWHYLLARRQEVVAFSGEPAQDVIQRDMSLATALAGEPSAARLGRLAAQLHGA